VALCRSAGEARGDRRRAKGLPLDKRR